MDFQSSGHSWPRTLDWQPLDRHRLRDPVSQEDSISTSTRTQGPGLRHSRVSSYINLLAFSPDSEFGQCYGAGDRRESLLNVLPGYL